MEARILVTSLNNHRNNIQASSLLRTALRELGYLVTSDITSTYNLAIVWGSDLDSISSIKTKTSTVLYMHVDTDITIPEGVTVVTQFTNDINNYYFPTSALAVFHKLWDNPIVTNKKHPDGAIYGGSYKSRRDYSNISKNTLILGDSSEWDLISNNRDKTIRDLDSLYTIMSEYGYTHIVYDPLYTGVCNTTRLYECVFTQVDAIVEDGSIYKHTDIKRSVTKLEMLRLTKQLIERFIDEE